MYVCMYMYIHTYIHRVIHVTYYVYDFYSLHKYINTTFIPLIKGKCQYYSTACEMLMSSSVLYHENLTDLLSLNHNKLILYTV